MFARVTTRQLRPEEIREPSPPSDEMRAALDALAREPGFRGAQTFLNRQTGKAITIGLWETEAAMQAALPGHLARMALGAARTTTPDVIETYELVGETRPQP
jgi:heme-degrading monooxygenase HmoA